MSVCACVCVSGCMCMHMTCLCACSMSAELLCVRAPRRAWAAGTGYGTGYRASKGEVWDARQGEAMQVLA